MASLELYCPAKINLMLNITGRRPDGYHELQTVFQFISLYDRMQIERLPSRQLELTCPGLALEAEKNLVTRAARLLQQHYGVEQGARIELQKVIPDGAGLGGGSSDAATALLALNQLWHLDLSMTQLAQVGLELGADVPVFIHGQSGWGEGVGEHIRPLVLAQEHYLLLVPPVHVSTAAIFQHDELTRDHPPIRIRAFFDGWQQNLCEPLVRKLYKPVDLALQHLGTLGQARMSGTGSSVFVALESAEQAEKALQQLPVDWPAFVVQGINQNPVHQQLGIALSPVPGGTNQESQS